MNFSSILLPVLVQIALTLLVFLILGMRKVKAIKSGGVDRQKTALDNSAWPEGVVKVSNNITNQFQTPVLFYILALLFYLTDTVNTSVIVLAWLYVVSRLLHAFIHINSNFVPARFSIFTFGVLSLIGMLVLAFIKLPIY